MRFVILHYHLFKNAGSTIEDTLDRSFGERFDRLETPVGGSVVSNTGLVRYLDDRPALLAVSSHQIRHPLPQEPGYLFFDICFLRDPIDRLRSFYDYFRQRPNQEDPMSDLANRCGLGDFAAGMIRDFPLFARNNQVNLLACAGDSDEPDERDLELAALRVKATAFLGVVDCFGQSVAAGRDALRCSFPGLDCSGPPANVSRGMQGTLADRIAEVREACAPGVYAELRRITKLDRRLVELARAEVLRRFERLPVLAETRSTHIERSSSAGRENVGIVKMARRFVSLAPYWRQIAGQGSKTLFDAEYYAASGTGSGALPHFLVTGGYAERKPHPLFDTAFYLRKYPDVAAAGVNPLCHYLKYGRKEFRQAHPLFDPVFYLERNPDVREAGLDPLQHYLRNGEAEGRKPHHLFEPNYYSAACRSANRDLSGCLLAHFAESGPEAANPHPLFDCRAYVDAHPVVVDRGLNPLVHYLESADTEATDSCELHAMESATMCRLDIFDASVAVYLVEAVPDAEDQRREWHLAGKARLTRLGITGSVALVWQDDWGATHWMAEPQQMPFLRAVSMDQIRAQIT